MSETSYQGGTVMAALALIGLALASGMFIVIIFPAKLKAPPRVPVIMPNGVSQDTSLNFRPGSVTINVGDTVARSNKDDVPHTSTATSWPSGAVKWDSGDLTMAILSASPSLSGELTRITASTTRVGCQELS